MNDWSRSLKSPNNVRRYFADGPPSLSGLRLLRVVFGPAAIRVALGFASIPAGSSDKWRRAGYSAVDLILRLSSPKVEYIDAASLLSEQDDVSVDLQRDRIVVRASSGPILVASVEYVDAQFVPDPVMQRLEASRDESGSEIEPSPFGREDLGQG